jgi:hypothetical protein
MFPATPLTSLPAEHQRFIEMFILAGGNLKEIASLAGVSYPTVRNRLDKVIVALRVAIENQTAQATETAQPPDGPGLSAPSVMADAAKIIKRIGSS